MNIGVYIRVSTHSQKSDSQRAEISQWLSAHGHDPKKIQWVEDKETGANLSRAGFNALSEAIFSGSVKTVIVWKLDRIARNMHDGINIICQWCESGVRVVSVTQRIDLSGTVGHLVAGVLFANRIASTPRNDKPQELPLLNLRGLTKVGKKAQPRQSQNVPEN